MQGIVSRYIEAPKKEGIFKKNIYQANPIFNLPYSISSFTELTLCYLNASTTPSNYLYNGLHNSQYRAFPKKLRSTLLGNRCIENG